MLLWQREKIKPLHCIDITAITGLSYISGDDDVIRIGGLTSLSQIERTDLQDPYLITLVSVARLMATQQTRTIATIAGNLCNASPAGDFIPPLIALGAYLVLVGENGSREIPLEQFMVGPGKTCLQHSELLTEICIPLPPRARASSYRRIDRTVVDIALVSAAGAVTLNSDHTVKDVKITLGAVAPTVIRSKAAETMLKGVALSTVSAEFLQEVGNVAARDATPISDVRASAEYRTAMTRVLVRRVLEDIVHSLAEEAQ